MNDNSLQKLQQILARDNELRSAQAKQATDQATLMKQAETDWASHVANTLLPAFKQTEAVLQKAGWVTKKTPKRLQSIDLPR
jgi:hypothetical protein